MKYPEFRFGIFVVVGVLIMVGMVALVGLLLGMLPEGLTVRRAELALGAGFVAVVGYLVYLNRNWRAFVDGGGEKIYGFWSYLVIIVYILASLRSYLWLVGESNGWLVIGSPFNLGDLALHMHLTQFLASGVRFWPESPIILDQIIRYPIGIHLFGAVLLKIGVSIFCLMIWMGLIGSFLAGVSLWRWGGVFGLCVLLLCGGLAGFAIWEGDWKRETLFGPEWKNLFLSVFVTQRGFLWALPAGLVLLERWRGRFRGEKGVLPLWVEWILLGLMPLFHVHTFIFLVGLLVVCWLVSGGEERRVFFWRGGGGYGVCNSPFFASDRRWGGKFYWMESWLDGWRREDRILVLEFWILASNGVCGFGVGVGERFAI
ncbi:MAG: hypothetical protein N2035_03890 [Chthoniobacterales bacterium]|nr:hypothetical protein [Chthoniobacterales bacterium]